MATRDELRNELLIILAAGRELPPGADPQLADLFLDRMHRSRRSSEPPGSGTRGQRRCEHRHAPARLSIEAAGTARYQ